ncbi:MAG: DNA topoisomerase I [Candidatus Aenigmatarchaeota archaeon]
MSYTLILTEKPSAAERIANSLADGEVEKNTTRDKVSTYRITRNGKEIVVVSAAGHLLVLSEDSEKTTWKYPVFSVKWKPTYLQKNNAWSKKYFTTIQEMAKDADEFISATDYDIEGSVIAYNIFRFICNVKDGKRMKFSTLTKDDLVDAYENASPHLEFPQIEAGLTRHYLDWYFGINMTRALTLSLESVGGYWTLSTGRVQGPTLTLLEQRQKEIMKFKPVPYWEIELKGILEGKDIVANHVEDKFWEKKRAEKAVENSKGKDAIVESIEKKNQKQSPHVPFDLTSLQRDSYTLFGYTPKQTLDIAQSLYEQAVISYPRTSSQKLPPQIGYKTIIKKLGNQLDYGELVKKLMAKKTLKPIEGNKIDPAHPAIYPTGQRPKSLNSYQKKIYDIIVKRFLAAFADPAIRELMKITIYTNGEKFAAHGARTVEANWIEFYQPYTKFKDTVLPEVKKGDKVDVKSIDMIGKETQPPSRYNPASILKDMEKLGLGTKATRAHILQTLYDRSYIKERSIVVTELGEAVVDALDKYCSEITSPQLTKRFEDDIEAVQEGKKKREDVVNSAQKELEGILKHFKENQKDIGGNILKAVKTFEKTQNTIGKCLKCKSDMKIMYSKRTKKRFVGCSGYPKCSNSYPLPQQGHITVESKPCDNCGLFYVSVKSTGRRPWRLCVKCGFEKSKEKAKTTKEEASKTEEPKTTKAIKTPTKTKTKTTKKATETKIAEIKSTETKTVKK